LTLQTVGTVCNGYSSLVLTEHSDEDLRKNNIIEYIMNYYNSYDNIVINLQEVPGDYLDKLKSLVNTENIVYHTYDRIPKLKNSDKQIYANNSESLVSLIKGFCKISTNVQDLDKGKAILSFTLDYDIQILNCHIPFKYNKEIITMGCDSAQNIFVCGDFNCEINDALNIFKLFYQCPNDKSTFITKRDGIISENMYDHILCNKQNIISDLDVDKITLSDHYFVSSDFEFKNLS
jgi:hypothetical protein